MIRNSHRYLLAAGLALFVLVAAAGCGGQQVAEQDKPEPNFADDGQLFVSIDVLKAEYDRQSDFVLADARPTVDYQEHHIAGAISTPFDQVEQHLDELPRDKWIVFY